MKWKKIIEAVNAMISVRKYDSVREVVYPKNSLKEFMLVTLSGFRLQRAHL